MEYKAIADEALKLAGEASKLSAAVNAEAGTANSYALRYNEALNSILGHCKAFLDWSLARPELQTDPVVARAVLLVAKVMDEVGKTTTKS